MNLPDRVGLLAVAILAAGCAASPPPLPRSSPPPAPPPLPDDPQPRAEPLSRYGNGPIYEVFGKPYRVLDSSYGYRERGVASWYGKKFHGLPTSSRETYDMHELTAAHKTLPLPTYVEVRNLRNDRTVIVRVNDRGPFVDNRIIDLSYAAARKLGMVRDGTSLVEVTAISFDEPPAAVSGEAVGPAAPEPDNSNAVYLQVGAFGQRQNAERRHRLLSAGGIEGAFVFEEAGLDSPLYRVRIGPLDDVEDYDRIVAKLQDLGIRESHLVTD